MLDYNKIVQSVARYANNIDTARECVHDAWLGLDSSKSEGEQVNYLRQTAIGLIKNRWNRVDKHLTVLSKFEDPESMTGTYTEEPVEPNASCETFASHADFMSKSIKEVCKNSPQHLHTILTNVMIKLFKNSYLLQLSEKTIRCEIYTSGLKFKNASAVSRQVYKIITEWAKTLVL